jgi:hypothetical protein
MQIADEVLWVKTSAVLKSRAPFMVGQEACPPDILLLQDLGATGTKKRQGRWPLPQVSEGMLT